MQIKITANKLEFRINEYQRNTGASKVWIAKKLGISKQRMYQLFKADNMTIDVALKFAEFLKCDVKDLFEYDIIETSEE